jgi:hypothetical protein
MRYRVISDWRTDTSDREPFTFNDNGVTRTMTIEVADIVDTVNGREYKFGATGSRSTARRSSEARAALGSVSAPGWTPTACSTTKPGDSAGREHDE